MTGLNQLPVWTAETASVRDHVLVENQHQPTTINLRTYIDARYKLTVYYNHNYGELFDLQDDPNEINNRWDDPNFVALKQQLMLKLIHAEMAKVPLPMPRLAPA